MKKMKKLVTTLLASIALLCVTSAVLPDTAGVKTVEAATVAISKTTLTLTPGQKYRLKVTGTDQKIKWKSSNSKVATVGAKGLVTAKAAGAARITATVGTQKYSCVVSVKTSIFSVSSTSAAITVNKTVGVTVTSKNNGAVKYHIDDTSIVSCRWADHWDNNTIKLYITGKKAGTTKIKISNKNNSKVLSIKVKVTQASKSGKTILKEYIIAHGGKNSDGNRFISRKATNKSNGDVYNFGIVYDASRDAFSFETIMNGSGKKSTLEMVVYNKNVSSVKAEYQMVSKFSAAATVNVSTYGKNTVTKFQITKKVSSIKDATASTTANNFFRISMNQWNTLLKDKVGIEMKDIGFLAYQ